MSNDPITFHPYTVYRGVAAEDIEEYSTTLLVICPELMPNAAVGDIGAGISNEVIQLLDRDGKAISANVTSANHIVATWEGESNKRYPSLIKKGEIVEVYRTEGQDKYRWRSTGVARDLRKTDRVHVEVGALNPNNPAVAKDDTNTYSAYLDSINKKVGFKTSKANGEAASFSMEADLDAGTFHVSDDSEGVGNRIFLDTGVKSGAPIFQVNLSTGATFKLEGKDAFLKIPGGFFADIGDRFVVNSPLTIFNTDKKGTIIFNAAAVAFNTAKEIVLNAGSVIGLNAIGTKVAGVFVAGTARIAEAFKSPAGSKYSSASINDPLKSPVQNASNTPDVTPGVIPYRAP